MLIINSKSIRLKGFWNPNVSLVVEVRQVTSEMNLLIVLVSQLSVVGWIQFSKVDFGIMAIKDPTSKYLLFAVKIILIKCRESPSFFRKGAQELYWLCAIVDGKKYLLLQEYILLMNPKKSISDFHWIGPLGWFSL